MPKILVIEDNPVEIETIKARLKQKNFRVLIANNGEDGIRMAIEENPDLIFMDMILPGMHGLEATIKLKQNPVTKDIPIVALTVMDSSDFVATCFKEGISAFIKKPYEFEEIFDKTEKILGIRRSGSKKVLIVETDSALATMMTMSLMRNGYQVMTSPNGTTGLIDINEENPDLVILDTTHSGNRAIATFEEMKKSKPDNEIPIMLIIEQSSPDLIQQELNKAGAKDYIVKPFSTWEFIDKIEKILVSMD